MITSTRGSLQSYALMVVMLVTWSGALSAAQRQPLLQEGKTTIFERVLTRPGAELAKQAGASGDPLPAFTRFYVYSRKQIADETWLEVGANHQGQTDGWLKAAFTVPWKQQLALSFTNPAGRNPVLFFARRDDLEAVLESETPAILADPLYASLKGQAIDPRIVSVEPDTHVDINNNFYLLPVIESEEIYSGTGRTVRMLKVASVTSRAEDEGKTESGSPNAAASNAAADKATLLRGFSSALVFVIDSTISMGPYIERTKEAVRRVYDRVEKAGLSDKVKFGLVAYRSNISEIPSLDYVAREFVDPYEVKDGEDFLRRVQDLKPASVSSGKQFDEDAYAGVMQALNGIAWEKFGARYLVLVTDAGALAGEHRLSGTGLSAEQVSSEARHRGVAIYAMHLKTPQGKKNHASAQQQYESLSSHPLLSRPLYYPVELGDVDAFGSNVDLLAEAIVEQVRSAFLGKKVVGSALTADPSFGRKDKPAQEVGERVKEEVAKLGYAMQLEYLGRVGKTKAPDVLQAWISDVDLKDPLQRSLDVRVLLTKNQLSDMQMVMKGILDASNKGIVAPETFFTSLQSFAASLGRDANRITDAQTTKLADLGLLGEYLDDLPYRSSLMNLDQETWSTWSVSQQTGFTNKIRRNMRLYEIYNSDVDRWISLAPGSHESEHVYPVPIDVLP